jgi:hypothetical protein
MFRVLFAPIIRSTTAAYCHGFCMVWCVILLEQVLVWDTFTLELQTNDERSKGYSVHLVGPELNIYEHSSVSMQDRTLYIKIYVCIVGRDSTVGIATRYGMDGPGIEPPWG